MQSRGIEASIIHQILSGKSPEFLWKQEKK
jgi:hypothetical protein